MKFSQSKLSSSEESDNVKMSRRYDWLVTGVGWSWPICVLLVLTPPPPPSTDGENPSGTQLSSDGECLSHHQPTTTSTISPAGPLMSRYRLATSWCLSGGRAPSLCSTLTRIFSVTPSLLSPHIMLSQYCLLADIQSNRSLSLERKPSTSAPTH